MEKETKKIKILAVQISSVIGDKHANFEQVRTLVEDNIEENTDLVVLPEVWTVGWACDKFRSSAENIKESETVNFLAEIAKKYNSYVAGGSFITVNDFGEYYNTMPFLDRNGSLVATYDKMHLFSYYGCDEGKFVTAGKNPVCVKLDNGIKVGLTICYDIRFPELYRAYRKVGADLFINSAAWSVTKPVPWEVLTKSRAVENQTYMVALTQSGELPDGDFNIGHSRIIDYKGETISEIGIGDSPETSHRGVLKSVLNFDDIYSFRNKCTVLNDIHKEGYKVIEI